MKDKTHRWPHPEAHPGEFLLHRFLHPLGISASEVARRIHIPRSRVSDIITGKRRISPDTAVRLARLFGTDPELWLELQAAFDLAQLQDAALDITPIDAAGFLIGPDGASSIAVPPRLEPGPVAQYDQDLVKRLERSAQDTPQAPDREMVHVVYRDGTHAWESKPK